MDLQYASGSQNDAGDVTDANAISASARYDSMVAERQVYLQRGRDCSALTVPSILPPQGFSYSQSLTTPYQSLGARGVRNLASKLLLSLFPSNSSFFEYKVDDQTLEKLGAARGDIEKALSSRERATITEVESSVFRPAAFQALMQLLVTGNALVYLPEEPDERATVYRLDQYVTRRDPAGNLLECCILEKLELQSLPAEVRMQVMNMDEYKKRSKREFKKNEVTMYTHMYLDASDGKWHVFQEVCGYKLPGSEGTFLRNELPYFALRFSSQPGEHYGRSYVEEFLGDLDSLEALSEALVEGSAASARILFMVDPAGATTLQVVATAKTGDVVSGRAQDVQAAQVNKQADLRVAKEQADSIATRISYAFLLHSSVQRNGERVTAEEIRYMAAELDDGLGGVYTLLAAEFQLPAVRIFEKRMEKRLKVPKLPDTVKPVLISGLEAIGRGHDQQNLKAFAIDIIQTLTPQVAAQYMNVGEYISRAAAGYNIDPNGLVKSQQEVEQAQQQQQAMAMMQQAAPHVINQVGNNTKQQIANQAKQSQGQ